MVELLQRYGFQLWAVADASEGPEEREAEARFREWMGMGLNAGMHWIGKHAELKYRPERLLEGAKRVLVVSLPYWQERPLESPASGRVARYAWGRDYHRVFQSRLKQLVKDFEVAFPGEFFRAGSDSHPVGEVHWAQRAGLGFRGRHTLAITRRYGSWHLLGAVITTAELPLYKPEEHARACPSWCFLCGQKCPTGALKMPGYIDARLCISYWTIETMEPVPVELREKFGNWIFGCDLCQEACPWNRDIEATTEADFLNHRIGPDLDLKEILEGDADEWKPRLEGTPLNRAGYLGLVRNACLAAGNSGRKELAASVARWIGHEEPGINEHARWAFGRLTEREEQP